MRWLATVGVENVGRGLLRAPTSGAVSRSPDEPEPRASSFELARNLEDAQACADLSESACREVPRNFRRLATAQVLTQLGDTLSSPKTVLAWVLSGTGAPEGLIGLLVPIRESGSMLPQLAIANRIRSLPLRKWIWIVGAMLQAGCLAAMGACAVWLEGARAGWMIVALLALFSLARGLQSVASKDVIGKTIPKRRRGRLSGVAATASGLIAMSAGIALALGGTDAPSSAFYGGLIAGAGALFLASAVIFARVEEEPGETSGGRSGLREALSRLALLRTDRAFGRFVLTRALFLCSALSAPYYVLLGKSNAQEGSWALGVFVIAGGLAAFVSAPIWGPLADRSSRRVMNLAGGIAASIGVSVFMIDRFVPNLASSAWTYVVAFLLLTIAHTGVRIGRKTYVIDMASGNRRTDYVSVSNTVIGAVLLAAGSFGALSSFLEPVEIVLVLSIFGALGTWSGRSLPEVE